MKITNTAPITVHNRFSDRSVCDNSFVAVPPASVELANATPDESATIAMTTAAIVITRNILRFRTRTLLVPETPTSNRPDDTEHRLPGHSCTDTNSLRNPCRRLTI